MPNILRVLSVILLLLGPALGNEPIDVIYPLIQSLNDNDSNVRANAVMALGMINDTRAVDPLIETLHRDESKTRCLSAIFLWQQLVNHPQIG